jgi:uncharacterized protein (TIGR02266 family)
LVATAQKLPELETDRHPTVLVIDDVAYLLELASLFLARTARVVTASDADDGLRAAWRERPDLILCDDRMPGLTGADLCRRIRQDPDLDGTPFIMLVSDPGAAARGEAIRAGADDVLAKPLSRLSLVEAVSRFLCASRVRGLPRIDTEVPVTVTSGARHIAGVVRNVSRGGAFIETEAPLHCSDEVELQFQLPESPVLIHPSAEVVWCRNRFESRSTGDGAGLRFVEIDGDSVRTLDDYVYERTPLAPEGVL